MQKLDNQNNLVSIFKYCLLQLRSEGIIGDKALQTLSCFLILKMIEPCLGVSIDIENYEYDFQHLEQEGTYEEWKETFMRWARFSNLSCEDVESVGIDRCLDLLWDNILCEHPITKRVFAKGKGFNLKSSATYKLIIDKLNTFDASQTEHDVLGNAYEEVVQHLLTGKVLGQFFTPPSIKKLMMKLINPQIFPDGKIESCADPTMGTAGFLTSYLGVILEKAKAKNIKPDWDFIRTKGLYGKELNPDTYQLAISNLLIASGQWFDKMDCGDSIRQPIDKKFDVVLANPPFGIKGFKYDEITHPSRDEYIPIRSDNAVTLFLQVIIYMLNIGGRCAIVVPDGSDLFSKTNKCLVAVREYLMKTCDLHEVIGLPSGTFTYTPIRTCILFFTKKQDGKNVLESTTRVSTTGDVCRTYKFKEDHATKLVKFFVAAAA
jgi:type I restriction-modification system DNA methylase subunit